MGEFDTKVKPPRYAAALDFDALWDEFPPPDTYFEGPYQRSRDEIEEIQNQRFVVQMKRAWQVPFYQRHWGAAGLEPGDIRSLQDLNKIPAFSVHDLRTGLEQQPFWADYMGIDPEHDAPMPLIVQTSGGTTGLPRPMLFSPRDREVMNIITGRRLFMQGVRPFDLVQICLSFGLTNGGLLAREGTWKYSGAVPVTTGSGAQTPTRRQIELIRAWKTKFLVGFPPYLKHMGLVARDELKIDPASLGIKALISHLGLEDRDSLERLWNADVFDTYGSNECGTMACECRHKTGMHLFEDAFVMEINDPDTMVAKAPGEQGTIFITTLFKHLAPLVRYNMNDVSSWSTTACACGTHQKSMTKLYGRSDNMVKLRGVNVFPEAIGALVAQDARSNGEYVCLLDRLDDRDEMTVLVELLDDSAPKDRVSAELAERFKEALSVKVKVEAVSRGKLDQMTGLTQTSKIKRLIDRRPALTHSSS
jgi:phenylacetate-CoA ligase